MPGAASSLREFGYVPGVRQRTPRTEFDFSGSEVKLNEASTHLLDTNDTETEDPASKPYLADPAYNKSTDFFDNLSGKKSGGGGVGRRNEDKS